MRQDDYIKNLSTIRGERVKRETSFLNKEIDWEVDQCIISEHFAAVARELAEAKMKVEQLEQELKATYRLRFEK